MATTSIGSTGVTFPDATVQATAAGTPVVRIYTSPSPWTKPTGLRSIKVTIVSGGGGQGAPTLSPPAGTNTGRVGAGGAAGYGYFQSPSIPASLTVTVGAGGAGIAYTGKPAAAGNSGGSSSFGSLISATGGAGGAASSATTPVAGGSITPSPAIWGMPGNPTSGPTGSTSPNGDAGFAMGIQQTQIGYGYGSLAQPVSPTGAGGSGIVIVEEFY